MVLSGFLLSPDYDPYSNRLVLSLFLERKGDSAKDRKDVEAGSNSGLMKKTRTKISLYQKLELECAFLQTPYPSRAVRAHLAHRLGLKHQTLLVSCTLSNWNLTRVTKKKQNGVKVPFKCIRTSTNPKAKSMIQLFYNIEETPCVRKKSFITLLCLVF